MRFKGFHDEIRLFEVEGIHMIGDLTTGTVLGLDEIGNAFCRDIFTKSNLQFDSKELNENQLELLREFEACNFYESEQDLQLKSAYVHVTDQCNLNCLGCYSFVDDRNGKTDMSMIQISHVLKQLKANGVERIVFSGGEPFIRNDFQEICELAKEEIGFKNLTVITNGTLPTSMYISALSYLDEVAVSIDGYDAHSHFIRDQGIMPGVIETIDNLSPLIPVSLIATLHSKNIKYMMDYQKFANDQGLYLSYSILSVSPDNVAFKDYLFSEDDFIAIHDNVKSQDFEVALMDTPIDALNFGCKGKCGVCTDVVSIGADGSIFPCHMMHDQSLSLGNINALPLKEALSNFDHKAIHVDKIEECEVCEYKYLCAGGCRGRSFYYTQSLTQKDPYCPLFKAHFKELMAHLKSKI